MLKALLIQKHLITGMQLNMLQTLYEITVLLNRMRLHAAAEFSLTGDELLPVPEAIANVIRQRIEQEHQVSDDYEP